ncbi:MAG: hypothetical protein LRY62_03790 [Alphaproteobacteria bacterium]|nr:hypothetical protein [Alphaproteobacteria bacterium]
MMIFNTVGAQAGGLPVPDMNSNYVRNAVESALDGAKCRIVKKDNSLGVAGDKRHKQDRGGASCHNQGKAIDIFARHVECDDKSLTGKDKLKVISKNIPLWKRPLLTICGPSGEGPCTKAHNGHLHIGAKESLKCWTPG